MEFAAEEFAQNYSRITIIWFTQFTQITKNIETYLKEFIFTWVESCNYIK
jgi:hypothetical protein